jgi:bifunctional DNase/RNase
MKQQVVPVEIRGIVPASGGVALFVGNQDKVFVIQVERSVGEAIDMALRGVRRDRPLTHDLMGHVFKGFGITVERAVLTELRNSTYFARLILKQENELGQKFVELDARPSDCLAIAAACKRPVFVTASLFEEVEDVSELLARLNHERQAGSESEPEDEDEDSGSTP